MTNSYPGELNQATCALGVGRASVASGASPSSAAEPAREAEAAAAPRATLCKADIARDDLTGLVLGPYALGRKVGGGGMGKVFTAQHTSLDKTFAIKFVGTEAAGRPEARARFEQEVKALGKLQHPHIVNAVDAGCVDGVQYLVTEFVQGEDLAQVVQRRGGLPVAEACELIRQAAVGLAHSHRCGFLHRDIKPSNLILDASGTVKLLDFGLVRGSSHDEVTVAGEMLGTWDFVAPEQTQDARSADRRSDLYSLGCTLLYLLSGNAPFSDARYSTPAAKLKGHLFDEPTWLKNIPPHVPRELAKVLTRLTAKSPEKRYADADEVAAALAPLARSADLASLFRPEVRLAGGSAACSSSNVGRRRRFPIQWAAAACVVLGGGLTAAWSYTGSTEQPAAPTPPIAAPQTAAQAIPPKPVHTQTAVDQAGAALNGANRLLTEKPVVTESSSRAAGPIPPTRVTNDNKKTYNAAAIRIGITDDAPAKPLRKMSAAP